MRKKVFEIMWNIWLGFKEGVIEATYTIRYYIVEFLKALPQILVVINPYLSMVIVLGMYQKRGRFEFGGEWLVPLVVLICALVAQWVKDGLRETIDGFPVARKRFTRRKHGGAVYVNKDDLYEMLEYLAEVEDYCDKKGKYRGKR